MGDRSTERDQRVCGSAGERGRERKDVFVGCVEQKEERRQQNGKSSREMVMA